MEPQSWGWGRYTFLIFSLSLQDCHFPQHLSFSEFEREEIGTRDISCQHSEFGEATLGEPGTFDRSLSVGAPVGSWGWYRETEPKPREKERWWKASLVDQNPVSCASCP